MEFRGLASDCVCNHRTPPLFKTVQQILISFFASLQDSIVIRNRAYIVLNDAVGRYQHSAAAAVTNIIMTLM